MIVGSAVPNTEPNGPNKQGETVLCLRRHRAVKREILPDAKFGDVVVSKFINSVMLDGKKSVAERIVYGAFDLMASRASGDVVRSFHDALDNVKPHLEVRSRRVGGATTKCLWKCGLIVPKRLHSAGLFKMRVVAVKTQWLRDSRVNYSMLRIIGAAPSKSGKIRIGWQRPTARFLIIVGN